MLIDDIRIAKELSLLPGGVHSMVITKNKEGIYELNDFLLTQENSIHMLWLLPQYFVITTGEIMLSITGLEFSYSQVFKMFVVQLQFNALQDSKMFVFLAKSLFDVDPIPFLESPEFYAKSGERVEKGHLLTCCRGMSLLLLHRWRPAAAPLMTF